MRTILCSTPRLRFAPRWLGFLLFGTGLLVPAASAQTHSASEDDIRAAMISHLPLFIDWPSGKADPVHPTFNVCLLGSDPIRLSLESQLQNKTMLSMPVVIQRVTAKDYLEGCYILYISAAAKNDLPRLLPALEQASVLVVSERPLTMQKGQVIGMPVEDMHVRVEINLETARESRLVISSRLLHLASVVVK